jgi:inositol phosphorylceramide synthase catalytic subunit
LRTDHFAFLTVIVLGLIMHRYTQKLTYGMIFFIFFWIIYDSLRAFPNYTMNDVSTIELYAFEKSWFGIESGSQILSPNEFFQSNSSKIFDFLAGIFYLCWVPVPVSLCLYFLIKDKHEMLRYSFVFLLINLIGFTGYYVYPAAPPWYFASFGDQIISNTMGNAAGLKQFDNIIGFPLFEQMYTKNSNVFAAVPSLHAAYPLVACYFSVKNKIKFFSIICLIVTLGIWFAAIYTYHHYVTDVGLGIITALFGLLIWELYLKNSNFDRKLNDLSSFINKI